MHGGMKDSKTNRDKKLWLFFCLWWLKSIKFVFWICVFLGLFPTEGKNRYCGHLVHLSVCIRPSVENELTDLDNFFNVGLNFDANFNQGDKRNEVW